MKFHFNERQRFSLRKYSFGLASVLLGTAFFLSGQVASADEVNVSETLLTSVVSVSPESSTSTSESSVPRTSESKSTIADKSALSLETADSKSTVADKAVETPEKVKVSSDSEKPVIDSPKSEKSEASAKESSEETAKATEVKAEVAEKDDKFTDKAPAEVAEKDDKFTDKAPAEVAEKDDKSTDKAPAEARRSTRTRRATSEDKREVSNWSEFVSALKDENVSDITVNGDIVAQGDNGNTDNGRSGSVDRKTTINAPSRPVTIQGKDDNARLELLSHTLELTGASWELNLKNLKIASANSRGPIELSRTSGSNTVTFENVTSVGSSLYGGGGNTHVVIKGTTTSTVSDSYQAANGQTQHVQRNVGAAGRSDQRRESNIHDAKSVTVAEGASLTLNRSSQGDAITLESGDKVSVKDKGSLTINMNTDNRSENARYHNAGIFMADSGTVETGKDSKLVLNTSIGQGISIGVNRPADGITDKDRYGGYVAGNHGRKNGPSRVLIGDGGTFEFHGRDGIMMGNHSELVTGQNAKVRFENKGRGVALDFGNDSRVVFGKHSNNTFHSVGKGPKSGGGPSGSYDGYNYIGLNENGKILVDDFATFRVQMDNRGDNAWDDVISLDSRNGRKSEPVFQANKGSIVDIRDDNTNYYAELISVALGASTNTYFQFNNPLYVSFMRYTKSDGTSAGDITGKLPITIPQGNNPQDIGHGNILYISNKSEASGNRIEFNGPTNNAGVGTYTVYSMNKDGRDAQSHNKQSSVWMNIQGGSISIAGFQNNRAHIEPANATSVPTGSSTGGVVATDRTYGIDPVGDNRQNIWVSNGSKINPTGVHKNVIKYVYEDGTPVKEDVIQSSNWNRTLDVSIDQEGFKEILKNSSVSNGDEFLAAYSKAKYHISDIDGDNIADTGWKEDGTNSGTYNYGTIASPKLKGYKPEILSTNVPGLEAGAKADSVSVSYDSSNATDTLIEAQAGKRTVSETYWRNIVAKSDLGTYETVVVYKKVQQKAIVKYIDTSDNNKELAKNEVEGTAGEAINYSTDAKIADFVNKGYKLVEDGFTNSTADQKKFDSDENIDQEFVVRLEHDVTPVGPNNPHKPTDPINPNDPKSPKYPATDQWKKDVTSTVHYVVSDGNATAPADKVQNAQWTRTLTLDKVTGEVLSSTPWASNKANYDAVPTPGLTGYYADKANVASKTVTQKNLEETVTYKPLGKLVPKPETPNDPNFPRTPEVKYPNDPTDPTKPGKPVVPDVPGYKPYLPNPNDPTKPGEPVTPGTPITPENPGTDTPIIYVPKTTEVTKTTKQTVTFEGAGTATPADKVQDNFTFTGKQKNGTTTWDQPNHTYGKETVPVVTGYYADKKEAGSKTVTPDQPEVTDKVTYKPLGKIIPVDPEGNKIPSAPTPQYNNDPQDPTKGGKTPTPVIPGYVTDTPSVTPNKPGEDTPVVYRKAEQKAIIKYVDQNTGTTLENDQVGGKSGEAIDYSTAAKIKYYEDRGYVLVSDEFPAGATYDTDASVDQTWTVTLKHGETPVGPNDPHNPTDPINPNDPNSPKYPAEDQWKKDVTSTVHYVVSDGKATAPADNVQNAQWTRTLKLDKVTGTVLNPNESWTANKTNYDAVPTPGLTGYYADKASVASKTVTQENLEETVTYRPLGNLVPKPETPNDPNFPRTPEVKYPNDPTDPTKPGQPVVPDVPGYEPHLPDPKNPSKPGKPVEPGKPITPENPGTDTPIIYRKTDQKAIIKYVDQNTGATLESDQVSGKSGEVINYSTAAKIKYYEDRGYVLVSDGFTVGTTYDKDESVDQEFVVTLKHGETPVGPNDPHKPTDPINPNDPDSPKYPAENQWKKDVTSTVHYVVSDGKVTAPTDNIQNAQWTRTLKLDKVTGTVLNPDESWVANKANYDAVQTPGLTGYYADKGSIASKTVTQENLEETVTYNPLGKLVPKPETPKDPNFPRTPEVKYPNDPNDPTKPGKPVVPDVPGYKPYLPDPNDPTKPGEPVTPGKPITPENPGTDTPIIYVPKTTEVTKPTKQTVTFEGAGDNTPAAKVQNDFTFTGKQKNGTTTWDQPNHTYGKETVPVVTGYYADKKEAGSKTVTPDQPEVTDKVTYKALGKIIQVDEAGIVIPGSVSKIYENNPSNPTEAAETKIPDAPAGYKIKEEQPQAWGYNIVDKTIEPNDESDPDRISRDTPIIYVPIVNDVTKPTKQTVTFEGAGTATPSDDVQSDYTFTGKKNQANGTTIWTETSHDYGKVKVPVVTGYYADKKEAGSKTVTPDQPEVTDKVTYKPLGKIIPVDSEGNKIPSAPTPQYNNDSQDPTKGGKTPTPVIPGYVTDTPSVTPNKPGEDTPVVYRKAEQKAIIKYVDQNTGETLENDQVGGKSGEAIDYSTADKIKYYEDRGYVLVSNEFPTGATYDTDASVDQTWTVTLKHGETPVGPNDPHKPTDPINPNDPNSPKYPAEDQWKKDVTSTVHYVVSDGKATAPADNVQNAQWTRTLNVDKVTGKVLNPDASWTANKTNYDAVPTPGLTGYYADKASVASKTVTQENLEETVTYKPLGNLVPKPERPNDPNFPSTPEVKYPNDPTDPGKPGKPVVPNVPGYKPYLPDPKDPSKPGQPVEPGKELPNLPTNPGDDTPIIYVPIVNDVKKPTKQTVKFEGAGDKTPADNVQDDFTFTGKENKASGTTTWTEKSHTYGKVSVPVIPGYYADKTEAGGKTVTPENPEATDTVTYKPLGKLVPKPERPNDPNFPSTPEVKYPNDPTDPGKPGKPVVPDVPGYKPYLPDPKDPSKPGQPVEPGKELPNLPTNPGDDTPIIYVPIVNDVKKPTKQTVKFEGAGDKTPADNVQDDFTFTGKENKASGTTTWTEKSHTYGKVSVPVIPGYYADKSEAGGKTVTPENPEATDTVTYKPLGSLVPKSDDPKFPSTPDVKYPNDPTDPGKPGKPIVPDVPGYKPYLPDPKDPSKPGKPVEPGKPITPENPGEDTPIIYVPIVNDVKKPTKQTVKFEGAGDKTPGDNVQDDFRFTGKENKASGTTTWTEKSHTYGKVSVPVIPGYYADKTEAGGKTVTPENPEATDTVTYKPLGNLVPKPERPNDPNFPSTPEVKYPNDPTDPGKPGKPVVPNVPGYKPYLPDPKDPSKPGQPVEPGKELPNLPTNPGDDTPIIYVPIVNDVKKPTKQTVKFEGAGDKTPADNVQDDFTFTGKENKASGTTTWTEKSHTYGKVSVPVIPGYYADKTEAGGKTVTPENPEATDTVTYKPLGKLVPKPERPNDPNFPSTPEVKYPNDPTDPGKPGKPGKPVVPDVPGYKPYLPDPKDPSKPGQPVEPGKELPNLPTNPGDDTPIIYVPIVNDVKKPTKQTVKFEGAGDKTPADNVQDDFTFTGKENKASGTTTWTEKSHTYGKVSVPVIPGYYADKSEAGGKTVTPENPEATDTVTYKPLGSLVPKSDDPKFPSTPDVKYPNDPTDPGKPGKPIVPDVPGYKPYLPDPKDPSKPGQPVEPGKELPNLPTNPGDDTPIIYVPIVNDVKKPTKQTVKFEGAGDKTPADNVQDDFTFTGKENKASGTTTWTEKSHTYGKVSVPVIPGYYADKTEAGGKTVTPENPEATDTVTYKPLGKLVPKPERPNDPNFPSTPEVKYPNDPTDPGKPGKPVVPDVPGYKPYLPDPKDPSKPGQPVEPGKELPNLPTNPGDDTPIIYVPIVNDVKKPTKQTVKFEGAGDKTPADNVQDDFTFTGKENKASGTTTWTEKSHTYGKVSVPVISGYYADKTEAGGKTVTPENPEATDTVTYKPLGKLVPKPERPNDPNFPSTPEVKYPNDPTDPGKPGKPVVPDVPGYKPYLPDPKDPSKPGKPVEPGKELPNLPTNPGEDTPIIYVPIVNDVKKPTKQTVKFEGAGDKTPADNVQDDFTFTGKENKASGTTTWTEKSYTYGKISVPVIPGYYADKTEAGGKTVTPENPEAIDTVTYKPLGKLVPKSERPNDPNFPSTPEVKYPNDPTDPGKPGKPVVPDVPGYKPYLPDPKDPSKPGQPVEPGKELPNLPTNPGDDTPIIYVPIVPETPNVPNPEPRPETPGTPNPEPKPLNPEKVAQELPNTGTDSNTVMTGLGIIGMATTLLGLARKKKED